MNYDLMNHKERLIPLYYEEMSKMRVCRMYRLLMTLQRRLKEHICLYVTYIMQSIHETYDKYILSLTHIMTHTTNSLKVRS